MNEENDLSLLFINEMVTVNNLRETEADHLNCQNEESVSIIYIIFDSDFCWLSKVALTYI